MTTKTNKKSQRKKQSSLQNPKTNTSSRQHTIGYFFSFLFVCLLWLRLGELQLVGAAVEDSEVRADEGVAQDPQRHHALPGVEGKKTALALVGLAVLERHAVRVLLGRQYKVLLLAVIKRDREADVGEVLHVAAVRRGVDLRNDGVHDSRGAGDERRSRVHDTDDAARLRLHGAADLDGVDGDAPVAQHRLHRVLRGGDEVTLVVVRGDVAKGHVRRRGVLDAAEVDGEERLRDELLRHHLVEGAGEVREHGHRDEGVREADDAVEGGGAPLVERAGLVVDAAEVGVGERELADRDGVEAQRALDGAAAVGERERAARGRALVLERRRGRVHELVLHLARRRRGVVDAHRVGDPQVGAAGVVDDREGLLRRADADLAKVRAGGEVVVHRDDGRVVEAGAAGLQSELHGAGVHAVEARRGLVLHLLHGDAAVAKRRAVGNGGTDNHQEKRDDKDLRHTGFGVHVCFFE
eukprot:PhM_4_TR12786/c0_g1_i1/m.100804